MDFQGVQCKKKKEKSQVMFPSHDKIVGKPRGSTLQNYGYNFFLKKSILTTYNNKDMFSTKDGSINIQVWNNQSMFLLNLAFNYYSLPKLIWYQTDTSQEIRKRNWLKSSYILNQSRVFTVLIVFQDNVHFDLFLFFIYILQSHTFNKILIFFYYFIRTSDYTFLPHYILFVNIFFFYYTSSAKYTFTLSLSLFPPIRSYYSSS